MRTALKIATVLACGWSVTGCFGGKKESGPAPTPVAPQGPFDPAAPGGMTPEQQAEKQKQEMALLMSRGVKLGEFALTLVADDSAVANLAAVNVDVISATAAEAARLVGLGPVAYREARITGNNTRSHRLAKGGRVTVNVPTIPAADAVVLWAELPPPAGGQDSRMLLVPLSLDKSDPAKGPLAHPIAVKLTANGWVREG